MSITPFADLAAGFLSGFAYGRDRRGEVYRCFVAAMALAELSECHCGPPGRNGESRGPGTDRAGRGAKFSRHASNPSKNEDPRRYFKGQSLRPTLSQSIPFAEFDLYESKRLYGWCWAAPDSGARIPAMSGP